MSNTVQTLTVRYRQEGGSELERMAKSIARAQQTVAEASNGAYEATAAGTRQLGGAVRSYQALEARLEGTARASRQFYTDVKALDGAMRAGIVSGEEYARKLAQISRNLEQAGAPSGRDFGSSLDISKRFNIGADLSGSARASASVFEESEKAAASLRAELYPTATAQQALNEKLASYRTLAAGGAISTRELADAEAMIGARMAMTEKTIIAAGTATKLTANQTANLGYQLNDIGTMLAMGASPFQVLTSQSGQVVQALGDGPGGVSGSLKAIGSAIAGLATPVNLTIAGLTAAAGAVIYFGIQGTQKVKPLTEAMEAHAKAIREIADSYDLAIDGSSRYVSGAASAFAGRRSAEDLRLSARTSLLDNGFAGNARLRLHRTDEGGRTYEAREDYKAFEGPLVDLANGLRTGTDDARRFVDEVARIADMDPSNAKLQEMAKELVDLARPAADAAAQLDAITAAAARLRGVRLSDAMKDLREFVPDVRTPAEMMDAAAERASGLARSYGELMSIERQRQAGLQEIARQEDVIRQGHELDLRSIGVRSAAERADIEGQRVRLDLANQIMSAEDRARRVQEAMAASLAQSSFDQAESLRQRVEAEQDAVASLMNEIGVLGKTAGEAARLTAEYGALEEAKRAAYDEGRTLGEDEIERIKRHAVEVGRLTDNLAAQKLAQDATFERSQLFRSDQDAAIASTLRGAGVDPESAMGRQFAAYETATQRLTEYRDLNRELWQGIGQDIMNGTKPLDAFANALQGVTAKMIDKGIQSAADGLFNMVFKGSSAGPLEAMQSVAAMEVRAAVVNIGGAGIASLTGSGSPGGAAGAIDRLLSPANSNDAGAALAGNSVKAQVANYFSEKGLAPHQIAGILGNVSAESAFNPTAVGDAGQAFGLFQHNDRKNALFNAIGGKGNLSDVKAQLDFAWKELQTSESGAFKRLLSSKDVRGATAAFAGFERPRGYSVANPEGAHNFSGRLSAAEKSFAEINGSAGRMAASTDSAVTSFASSASNLTSGLGGTFASLDSEMLRIAGDFTPKLGGALQSILDAFASSLGKSGGFSGGWISMLASSITGGMTGAPGGGDAWAGLRIGANANGTDNWPGGLSWVGEKGPELLNLPRGAQVVPNDLSRAMLSQPARAANINVNVINNAGVDIKTSATRPDGSFDIMIDRKVADAIGTRGKPANRVLREQGKLRRLS